MLVTRKFLIIVLIITTIWYHFNAINGLNFLFHYSINRNQNHHRS